MSVQQVSLTPPPVDGKSSVAVALPATDGVDDGSRPPRLPRWTRHEIFVLIQGKRVAESRVRRGGTGNTTTFSTHHEPKWASVSSYCKRHGVNRGPVQCRKRWCNLAGDFKKIKEWESQISDESESFWVMRNDLRRERKLPGFFDKEVYDVLDGGQPPVVEDESTQSRLIPSTTTTFPVKEEEVVFDSGRSAAAEDGLFSDQSGGATPETLEENPVEAMPVPISEKQYRSSYQEYIDRGASTEKQPNLNTLKGSTSLDGLKRKRLLSEAVDSDLQTHLIEVLERNGKILATQLEAQNVNFQLDRNLRKDYTENIVGVLNKLADALGRIADKL